MSIVCAKNINRKLNSKKAVFESFKDASKHDDEIGHRT
jgi:hypothetical protein